MKETLTQDELRAITPKWERIMGLREVASRSGRSVLEMALQFNLAAPSTAVALVGMRIVRHVEENLRYYAAPPLSGAEFDAIVSGPTSGV